MTPFLDTTGWGAASVSRFADGQADSSGSACGFDSWLVSSTKGWAGCLFRLRSDGFNISIWHSHLEMASRVQDQEQAPFVALLQNSG